MQKVLIPIILYLFINVLFIDKYTMRITEYHYICDALYICAGICLVFFLRWLKNQEWPFKPILWITVLLYCSFMIGVQYSIDPMSIQGDRWSAIHYFLDNLFSGIYPYSAQTHLGGYGSPFPIWQIIHIPFYLIGNVGLSFFFFLILFLYIVAQYNSPRMAVIALLLIVFSPAVAYEACVRSDLWTNFLFVCTICEWLRYKQIKIEEYTCLIAIICGLFASTRIATLIPLALLYGYAFLRMSCSKQMTFIAIVITTFSLTFLPFILWDGNQLLFFEYNPFVLQTRQGNPFILAIFTMIAVGVVLYKKDHLQQFPLYAGGLLTSLVIITFSCNMITSGNYQLFSSAYDITYFNMALSFYIYEMSLPYTQ